MQDFLKRTRERYMGRIPIGEIGADQEDIEIEDV